VRAARARAILKLADGIGGFGTHAATTPLSGAGSDR
jgi:hypothetical protein